MEQNEKDISAHLARLVEQTGARLVELVLRGKRGRMTVELFVDTEQGISADELASISRTVESDIEQQSLFEGSWTLNVSSPGLDRPLRFPWQYRRHHDRMIELLRGNDEETETLRGRIHDADDEQVVLSIGDDFVAIPYDNIVHAQIHITL